MISTFKDERGEITDLLFFGPEIAVTRITSKKGAIRGNHYHKLTDQWTYIVKGKTRAVSFYKEHFTDVSYDAGTMIYHPSGTQHAFEAEEDTEWIVFTKGPRAGENYEQDTYRLEIPLI